MAPHKRVEIVTLKNAGLSTKEVSKILGVCPKTIYNVMKRFNDTGTTISKPIPGRKRSARSEMLIDTVRKKVSRNPGQSMRSISKELNVSYRTMKRIFHEDLRINTCDITSPKIPESTRIKRLDIGSKMVLDLKSCANIFIWSGENTFMVDSNNQSSDDITLPNDGNNANPLEPPGVMVWAAVASDGSKSPLVFVDEDMQVNGQVYVKMLEDNVLPWLTTSFGSNYVFTQDDSPSHTSDFTQQWCATNLSKFWNKDMWPPASPDINPMDYSIWSILENEIAKGSYSNIASLKQALLSAWSNFNLETVMSACNCFLQRLETMIAAEGGRIEMNIPSHSLDITTGCSMVRNCVKKEGKGLQQYKEDSLDNALQAVAQGMSRRKATLTYGIPKSTIQQHICGNFAESGDIGRKTPMNREEEQEIALKIASLADFGFAFDYKNLRKFVKKHLDRNDRIVPAFKDNLPGIEWIRRFMKDHSALLSWRVSESLSHQRIAPTVREVSEYFTYLQQAVCEVPPANIVNYDEMNITDDQSGRLMSFRKGKCIENTLDDDLNSSISILFACTASGLVLDPYVVYKTDSLKDKWTVGGPPNAHYNYSKTGCFDSRIFLDWLDKVAFSYFRSLPADEPKVLVGDNISTHLSFDVLKLCEEQKVRLVFLPPKSSHFLQPLDVAVYGPLKHIWQSMATSLNQTKEEAEIENVPVTSDVQSEEFIPKLLLDLMNTMKDRWLCLTKSGFQMCGIYPFNADYVLSNMKRDNPDDQKECRKDSSLMPSPSLTLTDFQRPSTSQDADGSDEHENKDPIGKVKEEEQDETYGCLSEKGFLAVNFYEGFD